MIINPYLFAPTADLINTVAPSITGVAVDEYTLTCSTGTWTGSTPITYSYQWTRNGSNIGGATNSTYTLVTADVGQSILCVVTATNITGSVNANSNTVTPISITQYFINQAGITDSTQQSAINTLVSDLKGYNIWTKMKAIYPIVGGSSSTHKWNLKDPRDLDAAFRLTFTTGWTHSSTGMTPNGINAYANTALVPSTNGLTYNNNHLSFYSRTSTAKDFYEMGSASNSSATDILSLWTRRTANTAGYDSGNFATNRLTASNTDGRGFYINTAPSTTCKIFKNGTSIASKTLSNSSISTINVFVGGLIEAPGTFYYSDKQCAFASIGDGLSDTDAANYYTAVQAFQTTLGRQV